METLALLTAGVYRAWCHRYELVRRGKAAMLISCARRAREGHRMAHHMGHHMPGPVKAIEGLGAGPVKAREGRFVETCVRG